MKPVIAYVDDEIPNLTLYKDLLSENFQVETYSRSQDLINALSERSFDCFLLDIYMPVVDGFQLLERIRERPGNSQTPVFFITTNPQDEIRVSSYKKGATDFLDRMIKKDELIARFESKIKAHKSNLNFLSVGNLSLDMQRIDCHLNSKKVILTLMEFKILKMIIQASPDKITKEKLVKNVWGEESVNANNLNTHLYNLRIKLEKWDHEISNHRFNGFGIQSK